MTIVEVKALGYSLCLIALASCGGTTRVGGCPRTDVASALRTMKSWRYTPYRRDGRAVPVCTAVSFIYYPVVRYRR